MYPIDSKGEFDFAKLVDFVEKNPEFKQGAKELDAFGAAAIKKISKKLSEATIGETLHMMNSPEFLKIANLPYAWRMAPVGKGENYVGADLVAGWYKRNIRIFSNITRISNQDDRILVIYGQGHIPIIRDLIDATPSYCRVSPLNYLREPSTESGKK